MRPSEGEGNVQVGICVGSYRQLDDGTYALVETLRVNASTSLCCDERVPNFQVPQMGYKDAVL